jgi:formylglycine-generating enzyme required for sulfatase activity
MSEPDAKQAAKGRSRTVAVVIVLAGAAAGVLYNVSRKQPSAPPVAPKPRPARSVAESAASVAPSASAAALPAVSAAPPEVAFSGLLSKDLKEQKAALLSLMKRDLALTPEQFDKASTIVNESRWISQGNPEITEHPMTRAECRAIREKAEQTAPLPKGDARCGHANMVPIYDPNQGESAESARVCIDQYEFPNIPCEYPVVWVKADQAVELCKAVGKRICDAHEWEGACAGALLPAEKEYAFGQRRMMIEYLHNQVRKQVWAYGPEKHHEKCATMSKKSATCTVIDWRLCGSNTYPAGAFPECRSSFGVFDQHGNAAEHMNMPLKPEELASRGGLGETEMKGSWFIFSTYEAHPDDCRWRAPMWHKTRIDAPDSHRNYHLGFRCCSDIGGTPAPAPSASAP